MRGTVASWVVDVAGYAQVERAAESTTAELGGLDLLVNCAGIAGVIAALTDYPLDVWRQVQRVNLDGTFHACRAVVPYMLQGGYGRIVNVSSMVGKGGNQFTTSHYSGLLPGS